MGVKTSGTKLELAKRIYENKNSTRNRKIDQMFEKITNPNKNKTKNDNEIVTIHGEESIDPVDDNRVRKRMRDTTEDNKDDLHRVSSKSPRLIKLPSPQDATEYKDRQ